MRKVALHGSYFGYNFGDTLLCTLFCRWLHSATRASVVLPLASRRNLALINADGRGMLKFLSCSDLVFSGGGYFGERSSKKLRWSFRAYFRHFLIADLAMLLGKRVCILGTGAGPLSSSFLRWRLRKLVEYADVVIVRDEESRDFLAGIGVKRAIQVDTDGAMYLHAEDFPAPAGSAGRMAANAGAADRLVVVHLTNYKAPHWLDMACAASAFLSARPGIRIALITDTVGAAGKSSLQERACRHLHQLMPGAMPYFYQGDPAELCCLLREADLVITTKLHVGIVSTALGKKVISLPEHSKTQRFYRQLGMSQSCVMENQAAGLRDRLEQWWAGTLPEVVLPVRSNTYRNALGCVFGETAPRAG